MDLELKELEQYIGTEQYHKVGFFNTKVTDGVAYIMENGYSWFVTDALAVIKINLKNEEFLCVKLEEKLGKHYLIITDGNDKIFHLQEYVISDAKRNLKLFFTDNVLMLAGEY